MTKYNVIEKILGDRSYPRQNSGQAFAPSNIALCKYWGKRNAELNLPINSSLSISLAHLGTHTTIRMAEGMDSISLNGMPLTLNSRFSHRLIEYLNLFRPERDFYFDVKTDNNFPTAAGLASSASGYAAAARALNNFFGWELEDNLLSILARLGSGSASRSIYHGFVEWEAGFHVDGMDSYAHVLPHRWPDLNLAVLTLSIGSKPVGSTEGMKRTVETSVLYKSWPEKAQRDLDQLRLAIEQKDFELLGETSESNALAMHATMIDTRPSVLYWLPETVAAFHQIWKMRSEGVKLYFTIDAGPNVKILFLRNDLDIVRAVFPQCEIITPFDFSVS